MEERLLHSTVIDSGDLLTPSVAVETWVEEYPTHNFLYSIFKTEFMGACGVTPRAYLEGTIKGLHQTIRLELTPEQVEAGSELYHRLGEVYCTQYKVVLVGNLFKEMIDTKGWR